MFNEEIIICILSKKLKIPKIKFDLLSIEDIIHKDNSGFYYFFIVYRLKGYTHYAAIQLNDYNLEIRKRKIKCLMKK